MAAGPVIALFDSGIGGLSVLRALGEQMPLARFVYVSDNAHAPYGERSAGSVTERCLHIAEWLRRQHAPAALVVACNTATAHGVQALREAHPALPIIGVEPALKPATRLSHSGHVGVLATRGTLASARFRDLLNRVSGSAPAPVQFHLQACDGLADAIERGDDEAIGALCRQYLGALGLGHPQGHPPIDTLVLGCTHYPLVADTLASICGPGVRLIEPGPPVASRTRDLLGLAPIAAVAPPVIHWFTTGDPGILARASGRWLKLQAQVQPVAC